LGYQEIIIGIVNKEALSALSNMSTWPRYRSLLERIMGLKSCFRTLMFEQELVMSNSIARDIARSVLRDGMFQSYLAPCTLHWAVRHGFITGFKMRLTPKSFPFTS
ncbi:unnamed protein product, partial [Brassica oleracea]